MCIRDSNAINQKVIVRMLERLGATATLVGDGAQLVAEADDARYDVALVDVMMPVMDGLEAARALRARGSTLRLVALTANSLASDRDEALAAGCDAFLTKPVTLDALAAVLTAAPPPGAPSGASTPGTPGA